MHQPVVFSKRMVVRVVFSLLLAISATVHQESLQAWQDELATSQKDANTQNKEKRSARERSKSLVSDSSVALERAKTGCTRVVMTHNNNPARFFPELRVFDARTFPKNPKTPRFDRAGNPINGTRPYPNGISICNEFGDTAVMGDAGTILDIKRVTPEDIDEYLDHYKQKK